MRKTLLSLLALGLVSAAPALAATYYVPRPYFSGVGKPETKLEVSKDGGPRRVSLSFIEEGKSGAGARSSSVNVDNGGRSGVFNVTPFLSGPGLLRLETEGSLLVRTGTIFLDSRVGSYAWQTPVLTSSNWFLTTETAHLQNLERTGTGFANISLVNFSTQTATCQVQLRDPAGAALGSALSIPVLPLSQDTVEDPLRDKIGNTTGAGFRAEVSCNQPFYAYGVFVDTDASRVRLHYPLDAPPAPVTETVSLDRNGVFFAPSARRGNLLLEIPLVPNRDYRKATIDFDMTIKQFTPLFTGILGMYHQGGGRFNKTLYFGTFIRGFRNKTMVDLGSAVLEPTLKVNTSWKQNALHHVTMVFDAESATVQMRVTRAGAVIMDTTGSAYNLDLANRGNKPVMLSFGLPGVADHAYYPPVGWKFSNLKVRVTR